MDEVTRNLGEDTAPETPEDVAILYSWANLHGAKYRDFSASRREFRAQQRHRQMEVQREAELRAAEEKQESADRAVELARLAEDRSRRDAAAREEAQRARAQAEERAQQEREAAEHHARQAEQLRQAAERAEQEVKEARRRAAEQNARYAEAERRWRAQQQVQQENIPGIVEDPYYFAGNVDPAHLTGGVRTSTPSKWASESRITASYYESHPREGRASSSEVQAVTDKRIESSSAPEPFGAESSIRSNELPSQMPAQRSIASRPEQTDAFRSASSAATGQEQSFSPPTPRHAEPYEDAAKLPLRKRSTEEASRMSFPQPPQESVRTERYSGSDITAARSHMQHTPRRRRFDSATDIQGRTHRDSQESGAWMHFAGPERRADMQSGSGSERAVSGRRAEAMGTMPNTPEWLGESREYRVHTGGVESPFRQPANPSRPEAGDRAHESLRDAAPELDWHGPRHLDGHDSMRSGAPGFDTLQQSRERVAAQWYALRGLMGHATEPQEPAQRQEREHSVRTPMLIVVSMAGGVGKTSMVATLGRVLSSMGEKVLLADTSAHGLLPYYFGARESRPDVVRTFSPPPGSPDAPVNMVNYGADRLQTDEAGQTVLLDQLDRDARDVNRILLDLSPASMWLVRRLGAYSPSVLVPISPDINSVLSINAMERALSATAHGGRQVQPYFVMTHFDPSLPLHLDVREALRQQLGERLLTWTVRRSQAVSEALAEGMTVVDYAPSANVTEDYTRLADWVRHLSAPQPASPRKARWSER